MTAHNVVVGILSRKNTAGQTEYLLVKSRANFGSHTGCWYPPGGHIEPGETEEQALIREVKEELDLNIKPVLKIVTSPGDIQDQITHWWQCELLPSGHTEPVIDTTELAGADWFTREQLKQLPLWPATASFFNNYL